MRPITDVMRDVRAGKLVDQATRLLYDVTQAVIATGKAGEVTIKLKLKPGDDGEIVIVPTVAAKKPERDIKEASFYVNADGDLLRENPRQGKMFHEVDDERTAGVAAS